MGTGGSAVQSSGGEIQRGHFADVSVTLKIRGTNLFMELVQNVFELAINITEEDIDQLGHVNNVVYVRWVQEAAIAHWNVLASAEEREKLLWVVIRHEIDYKHPALLGDAIVARTWVGEAKGLAFERNTEIVRVRDRKLLARARTLWCPVNAKTLRPTEPGDEARRRFSTSAPKMLSPDVF
jgi:acyl-CoA thioester hydrolase